MGQWCLPNRPSEARVNGFWAGHFAGFAAWHCAFGISKYLHLEHLSARTFLETHISRKVNGAGPFRESTALSGI
jgi:hypothetical protein